ncbi:MAG: hypothetical protein AAFX99_04795 [Myxococcota bacterium]
MTFIPGRIPCNRFTSDGFRVGNTLYDHGLSVGETVSIIGVLDYTFSEFVLLPRSSSDILR